MVLARPDIGSAQDEASVWFDITALEAAVLAGHRQAVELLLRRLAASSCVTSGWALPACIGRHLGAAAAFLGRPDEARKYYQEAIKVCTEMRFRPELALTRLQLAELLLEHYPKERAEALEHLDFAIKESQEMKMQPSLERALRHKEILKA
jgi:tetratricopeptide (TPR) repeat protein